MAEAINWDAKAAIARNMSDVELWHAYQDCLGSIRVMGAHDYKGKDGAYYADEASIYWMEMKRRRGE